MTGFNGTLFCYGQTGSGKTFSKPAAAGLGGLFTDAVPLYWQSAMMVGFVGAVDNVVHELN
jgi:hypothetical protein